MQKNEQVAKGVLFQLDQTTYAYIVYACTLVIASLWS